ncbi:ABC transporter permease [Paenibacillus sp. 598K]|uniref:ABC transporter permease n=1 Tax=Paenibacillus sp. 598K TaxID=1117987 RepID=UPI000FFF227C|nr:ABC transporter permease [Paenibacillus sp. 598K]
MLNRISFHLSSSMNLIRANRWITCFTATSYFIGILMPTFVLAIMAHDEKQTKDAFMQHSEQIIQIEGFSFSPENMGQLAEARILLNDRLNQDSAVQNVFFKTENSGILASGTHMRYIRYVYVSQAFDQNFKQFLQEGRWFDSSRNNECVVGTDLINKLQRASGVQEQLYINNKPCTIIGTTAVFPNRVVMLHQAEENWRGYSQFYVRMKDSHSVEQMISSLKELPLNVELEKMSVINNNYLAGQRVNYSLLLLITLSVFVYSLINISNVIKFMLDERRSRYGIQLATGSTKGNIILEFFIELLLITSISLSAVLGILFLSSPFVGKYILPIRIDGWVVAATFSMNFILCGLLSLLYLKKVLSQDIISLIRGSR